MRSPTLLSFVAAATAATVATAFVRAPAHPTTMEQLSEARPFFPTTALAAGGGSSSGSSSSSSSSSSSKGGNGGVRLVPTKPSPSQAGFSQKLFFGNFLPPYGARDTVRTQVSEDIWLFEQAQTFVNVSVNIRSTVIRMKDGGLFVHAPVAPTAEYVTQLKELGEVKHVVLPVTAVEHKQYMAAFVRKFPRARVYVAPGQFSWPVDLPLGFRVDAVLSDENKAAVPFADEIDFTGWFFKPFAGSISEVAFFHKKSRTLLVTDAVIYIDDAPPEVLARKGVKLPLWKKMALQACFLGPPNLDTFDQIKQRLFVSPVIRILVVSRAQAEVGAWISRLCKWPFEQIIPAHFSAPIKARPQDLRDAYSFLEAEALKTPAPTASPLDALAAFLGGGAGKAGAAARREKAVALPERDTAVLKALDKFVSATGLAN